MRGGTSAFAMGEWIDSLVGVSSVTLAFDMLRQ